MAYPSKNILIAEDEEDMREYLNELLSPHYHTVQAANGAEALKLIRQRAFDLVLSDLSMPYMDGLQLLQHVRNGSDSESLPFLMIIALAEKQYILAALRLGVDAYLIKPFDVEELLARVENMLCNYEARKKAFKSAAVADKETAESYSFINLWLKELEQFVSNHIANSNLSVPYIAHGMSISERTLRNKIRLYTGLSPVEYLLEARLKRALFLLENEMYSSVSEVMYAVGLRSVSYFAKVFKERYGKKPSVYLGR
jgi:YesN/AraC family two-component response regulator